MAIEIEEFKKREFKFKKNGTLITLPDPDPTMSTDEVLQFHSNQYPELTTAKLEEPTIEKGIASFNIITTVGDKG